MALQVAQKTQVVKQYQRSGKDTGSPEVQIALLTERINGLTEHFKTHVEGFPFPPRAARDGEPAPEAARLPEARGRGQVPRPDRAPRSAQVSCVPAVRQRARAFRDKGFQVNPIKKTFTYGSHQVTLETGEIARQAHGAVLVTMDDTVVLAAVTASKTAKPGQDFFPLTVDYAEKTYAAGKIPGGFFKREGRPTEKETLTSRLIDRPIRPLFPDGFYNEVQVVAQVLSLNPEVDSDIPAMIGVSAALTLSGVPFNGPDRRVPRRLHRRPVRPQPDRDPARRSRSSTSSSPAPRQGVLMVESEALELSEDVMLGARDVRPRADAGRDPGDQRARRGRRQAGLGLEGAGEGRGAHRARSSELAEVGSARGVPHQAEEGALGSDRRDLEAGVRGASASAPKAGRPRRP